MVRIGIPEASLEKFRPIIVVLWTEIDNLWVIFLKFLLAYKFCSYLSGARPQLQMASMKCEKVFQHS